jgi:transcriptional regulator with GAF, ATPase, and Fis domain
MELFAAQSAAALENARAHRAQARALEAAHETILRHRPRSERRFRYEGLIGASDEMQKVYSKIDQMAPTEMPVIILGETGTGKELVARLLHARGPAREARVRRDELRRAPETLLEGELFGHERGAFTGAERTRPGLFELADGGTLFLDESAT